jgi:DNA mismatch repair protein MutS2
MLPALDLLHREPRPRIKREPFNHLLAFAFATGAGTEEWERARSQRELDPSDFEPSCFSQGLGLSAFAERLGFVIEGRAHKPLRKVVLQLLQSPPRDRESVCLRHRVLQELQDSPPLRHAFERIWTQVDALEQTLLSKQLGQRLSFVHRRVEILRRLIEAIDALQGPFEQCQSELSRVAAWAKQVRDSEAYKNLHRVLQHEDNLASVEVSVRLGYDGNIRQLAITRVAENASNPFHRGPWQRLFGRFLLWFRGYTVRQSEVLGRMVEALFDSIQPLVIELIDFRLDIEWYLCALDFKTRAEKVGLGVCVPAWAPNAEPMTQLTSLFNPFLLAPDHGPVPCDMHCPREQLIIVTGPNSGGKTRLLQSIGLAQLLAQSGFYVPAQSATMAWRTGLFVSGYEETVVDQDEGRLGVELVRIRGVFERIRPDELVILDELCSGTNPSEAEALIRVVLELLGRFKPQAFITTHFLEFARGLSDNPPIPIMSFLQAQLDARQKPTYQFVPGVATTSLAAQTAARLGVTREDLEAVINRRLAN